MISGLAFRQMDSAIVAKKEGKTKPSVPISKNSLHDFHY